MTDPGSPGTAAFLVGVGVRAEAGAWSLEASLEELEALAATGGLTVVGTANQRLEKPAPAPFIGSGKVDEVKAAALEVGADLVVLDHDLVPRQQRNLEQALDCMVLDRTALILDIFAQHARTREGMLQVELAQYEYRLPRLTRMWTHLARQAGGRAGGTGGGVGLRGPGETQLEIDRREIQKRMKALRRDIQHVRNQRRLHRRRRRRAGLPTVSLVGYTNAGKSTLLNAISGAGIYVADQLFATLDPTTRRIDLPSGRTALVTDTVGFIQRLPTQLVAAFRATLEEIEEADLLLHVADVSHPDAVRQAEAVEGVLRDMGLADTPMVVAANKIDRLADVRVTDSGAMSGALGPLSDLYPDLVPVSAATGDGLEALLEAVDRELARRLVLVTATVPYQAGEVVHLVHSHGVVEDERFVETGTRLVAKVPPYLLGSLEEFLDEESPSTDPV
ncbi:MAG: GTPase HflX [Anaerolineae bacterium]